MDADAANLNKRSSRWQQLRNSDLYDPLEHEGTTKEQHDQPTPSAAQLAAEAAARLSQQILQQQTTSLDNYIPVNDPQFILKLEKSVEKNFSYIRRKDEAIAQMILAGGDPATVVVPSSSSGARKFQKNLPTMQSKAGIGAPKSKPLEKAPPVAQDECTRIYISGLPKDISEDEIDILFSPQGKIKKIKLYTNPDGSKKGDALVTFLKAESAVSACLKLNTLDIGEGHVLSVTMADFSASSSAKQAPAGATATASASDNINGATVGKISAQTDCAYDEASNVGLGSHPGAAHRDNAGRFVKSSGAGLNDNSISARNIWEYQNELRRVLPSEIEAGKCPVVLILNTYDTSDPSFDQNSRTELQTDMLEECCRYGNLKAVDLLAVSPALVTRSIEITNAAAKIRCHASSSDTLPLLHHPPPAIVGGDFVDGAVAAAYESDTGATACCAALNGRWFGGRQLWVTMIHAPVAIAAALTSAAASSHIDASHPGEAATEDRSDQAAVDEVCAKAANDVEDFLNSLLDS